VDQSGQSSAVVEISSWLARATLDAIGTGQEYLVVNLGKCTDLCLQRHSTISSGRLTKAVLGLFSKSSTTSRLSFSVFTTMCSYYHRADAFLDRSDWVIAYEAFWGLVPDWLITLLHHAPTRQLQRLRSYMKASREVAQMLLDRQVESHAQGKDFISLLSKPSLLTVLLVLEP
jgi:hypothetical protein